MKKTSGSLEILKKFLRIFFLMVSLLKSWKIFGEFFFWDSNWKNKSTPPLRGFDFFEGFTYKSVSLQKHLKTHPQEVGDNGGGWPPPYLRVYVPNMFQLLSI